MPSVDRSPVFVSEGDMLIPQPLATGPWYAGSQHGSAMLGLLARAIERHPSERPMQVTRLTVDLMRAAPMRAVRTPSVCVHGGKSMETIEATIEADGEIFARATAMRLRMDDIDTGDEPSRYGSSLHMSAPPEGGGRPFRISGPDSPTAFHHSLEMYPVRGLEGPAMWFRMCAPLVEGETTSPLVRAAITSDWTYSVPFIAHVMAEGAEPPDRTFSAINPDTTLNLHRPLTGDWVCVESQIHYGPHGTGTALAFLYDAEGPIGHASQAILLRGAEKLTLARSRQALETKARVSDQT